MRMGLISHSTEPVEYWGAGLGIESATTAGH